MMEIKEGQSVKPFIMFAMNAHPSHFSAAAVRKPATYSSDICIVGTGAIGKTAALFTPAGGEEVIEVKASGSCSWQAQASVPWIKISSGTGVSGSGIISYTVTASAGKGRTGSISLVAAPGGNPIRGQATVVVSQPLAVGQ